MNLANTMTIVSCQVREQKIWDDYLNDCYGEALNGGTFASVATGNCMRATTGQRAIELRVILDDLDQELKKQDKHGPRDRGQRVRITDSRRPP
jgi:uncharacterized protein YecT (DUF1311 family)